MASRRVALAAVAALAILSCASAQIGLIVFGDSLSDTGVLYNITNGSVPLSPPYFEGMFTNSPGPWPMRLAEMVEAGTYALNNYAIGGARACNWSSPGDKSLYGNIPCVIEQVSLYLENKADDAAFAEELASHDSNVHVIWGGHNDLLGIGSENLTTTELLELPFKVAKCILTAAEMLLEAGEDTVIIATLAPLNLSPVMVSENKTTSALIMVIAINEALRVGHEMLRDAYPMQQVALWNVNGVITSSISNYKILGFTYNNTVSCLTYPPGTSVLSGIPPNTICPANMTDNYIFYDTLHPTSKGHAVIAASMEMLLVDTGNLGTPEERRRNKA